MNFKQTIFPLLCLIFLAIGSIIEYNSLSAPRMDGYLEDIEQDLHGKEMVLEQIIDRSNQLERIILNDAKDPSIQKADFAWLEKVAKENFTFQIYQKDSLLFWSNNHIAFHKKDSPLPNTPSHLIKLNDGYYEAIQHDIEFKNLGNVSLLGFIPIKYQYSLESNYLRPKFAANSYLPNTIEIQQEASDKATYELKTHQGITLGFLSNPSTQRSIRTVYLMFFAYLLGFIFLGIIINKFSKKLVVSKSLFAGASFLILTLAVLRFIGAWSDFNSRFQELPLFEKTPEVFFFGNSLGDFLINISLLLWVVLFVHRHYQIPYYNLPYWKRFGLVFLNAFGIIFFIANVASMLKQLIYYSNIDFNFENVFNLNGTSLLAIGGVILLLISLFLICHLLMMIIAQNKLVLRHRLMAYALAILTFIPLSYAYGLNLISLHIFLFLILFIGLFDIFIEHDTNNLTWLVTWLVLLAGLSSSLLYSYNQAKEAENRHVYVKNLIDSKDTIAEANINTLTLQLLQDPTIQEYRQSSHSFDKEEFYKLLDNYYSNNSYLYNNYDYLSYFEKNDALSEELSLVDENDTSKSSLYLSNFEYEDDSYLLKIPYYLQEDMPEGPQWWFMKFFHKPKVQSRVYSELLKEQSYKNLDGLNNYDYAIYKGNTLVNANDKGFSSTLNTNNYVLKEDAFVDVATDGILTSTFLKGNKLVVLEKGIGGYVKPVSLFSFIFALLILFVFIMSIINTFSGIFPKTLSFSVIRRPSLRGKIQLYVISLIVVSFILIGVVTVVYFSNSHEEYHENRLSRKSETVIKDTEHELNLLIKNITKGEDFKNENLSSLDLEAISKIHRMDVNLYNQAGVLVQSSEKDIFRKGIVSPQMNALAYQQLARQQLNTLVQDEEKIGTLAYKSAYIPLKTILNGQEKTMGYLGLPYYSKQSKLREDVTVFMGTLLNVYVFLLIIAGAIAIFVANSITKPIAVIGEKLKEFKLGGRNETLEWRSHDELGALIEEYNRMVLKIKEGADTLAQSEREGAWREMAKQVAHEIKNPLTPMKLSIQYLQHAYRSNPTDIEPLLKRVSNTLIEQIDNLSQIASEFSNFAKMPRAENQRILLNNLVSSVYDLFKEHRDMGLKLNLPEEEYYVYADKNHLIRVFNNLIKNAIQAIPDDRQGDILVRMFTEKGKILVEVRDNGTGISDEMREKVFVPNFTTKNSGTGLGLAISKNIIESVNGEIYFNTKIGKGTSFFVKLPVIDVKKPEEILAE